MRNPEFRSKLTRPVRLTVSIGWTTLVYVKKAVSTDDILDYHSYIKLYSVSSLLVVL